MKSEVNKMKKVFTRVISVMLALLILSSLSICGFAKYYCDCGSTPTVFVTGINTKEIYRNPGQPNEEIIFPPDVNGIMKLISNKDILNLSNFLLTKNYSKLSEAVNSVFLKAMRDFGCDANGNIKENTGIKWDYSDNRYTNHGGEYSFYYDWRLDPMDVAKQLDDFINNLLSKTNHEKVNLIGFSMGSAISCAYLQQFGYGKVKSVVLTAPAFNGVSSCGQPFAKQLDYSNVALSRYICDLFQDDMKMQLLGNIVAALSKTMTGRNLENFVNDIIKNCGDDIYVSLTDVFVTLPGMWCLVPDDLYDICKKELFKDTKKYEGLIKKIDLYHKDVQQNNGKLFDKFIADGHNFGIVSKYGLQDFPVLGRYDVMSDTVVDTGYSSFGATCSSVVGTLGDNYKQVKTDCGHNHVSYDNMIDASTCRYPEYTWFVKGLPHSNWCDDLDRLHNFILNGVDGRIATIHDSAKFPQFLKYVNRTDSFVPLQNYKYSSYELLTDTWFDIFAKIFYCINNLISK